MATVRIKIDGSSVSLADVNSYEQAFEAFELLAKSLPRKTKYVVRFQCGEKKIQVIKAVREVTNMALKEAKDAAEAGYLEIVGELIARKFTAEIQALGATVQSLNVA